MSVTKDKTLATIRTFAQDFNEHKQPEPKDQRSEVEPTEKKDPIQTSKKAKRETPKLKKATGPAAKPIPKITVSATPKKEISKAVTEKTVTQPVKKAVAKPIEKSAKPIPKITVKKTTKKDSPKKKVNTGAPATVITGKKQAPGATSKTSLMLALKQWFGKIFASKPKAQTPTYSVNTNTRRKGVIRKATTKSGAVFTSDKETLREAIVRRRSEEVSEPDVTWTPNTEPGFNLLDAPHETSTPPTIEAPEPIVETPPPEVKAVEAPQPVTAESDDTRWESVAAPTPEPSAAESTPAPETVPPETAPEPVVAASVTTAQPEPAPKVEPFRALRSLFKGDTENLNTNAMTLGLLSVVAGAVALVFVVDATISLFQPAAAPTPQPTTTPLVTGLEQIEFELSSYDQESFAEAIETTATIVLSAETEISFTYEGRKLESDELIRLMELELNTNFQQSISDIRLVVIDTIQHALLIEVTDQFTALGGMLDWESRMQNNLEDILFTAPLPPASLSFNDQIMEGTDVRVLSDGTEEVLIYGFIEDDVILITKTSETFTRLMR